MLDEYVTEVQSNENPVTSNYFETSNESYVLVVASSSVDDTANAGESLSADGNVLDCSGNSELPGDIIDELCQMHDSTENYYEEYFRLRIVEMIERDFKSKHHKNSGVEHLLGVFGDILYDVKFVSWLCRKIKYRPYKLKSLIENYRKDKQFQPRLCTTSGLTHRTVSLLLIVGQVEMKFGFRN